MPSTTDFAIVAVPLVACLALFAGLGLLNRPAVVGTLSLPTLQSSSATAATPAVTTPTVAVTAPTITATPQAADAASGATVSPEAAKPDAPASGILTRGRELAALLYSQRLTALWNAFTPAVQQEWGTFQQFQAYRAGGLKAFGAEQGVVSEQVRRSGNVAYYTRTARFEHGPQHAWTLVLGLNPASQVVAFNIVNTGVLPTDSRQ